MTKSITEKLISWLLTAALLLTTMPAMPVYAVATNYLDHSGIQQTSPSTTAYDGQTALTTGWHVVTGEHSPASRITVTGEVHIILANDSHLNANSGGIQVQGANSLTIYAQSTDANIMGKLTATGSVSSAGIGGNAIGDGGTITINGGTVTATGDSYGAGIGGA
jgi:hypothetical protein